MGSEGLSSWKAVGCICTLMKIYLVFKVGVNIVICYRAANAEKAVINPPAKSERRRWSLKDVFVVIAEKE
jgi:hypothetical protein